VEVLGLAQCGGVVTGLGQTQDVGVAFSVLIQSTSQNQQLLVVKTDPSGNVVQERVFLLQQTLSYPLPSNNLVVKANGDLVLSRHTVDGNGTHYGELLGLSDSLMPSNGFIKWRSNYEVGAIHALAYQPTQDSMAIFFPLPPCSFTSSSLSMAPWLALLPMQDLP